METANILRELCSDSGVAFDSHLQFILGLQCTLEKLKRICSMIVLHVFFLLDCIQICFQIELLSYFVQLLY